MPRKLTDRVATVRTAIATVLASASAPMTAADIAGNSLVTGMGLTNDDVNAALTRMVRLDKPPFPLKRVLRGDGNNRWAYYNPTVCPQLEDRPRPAWAPSGWGTTDTKPAEPAPAPNPPPEFRFDPVPFTQERTPPTVDVPPEVKSITIRVGGVSIHVELDGLAAAR